MARPNTGRRIAAPKKNTDPPKRFHFDRRANRLADEIEAGGKPDDELSPQELADALEVTRQWTHLTRADNSGPPFIKPYPEVVRYRRGGIVKWLRERARLRAAEYA